MDLLNEGMDKMIQDLTFKKQKIILDRLESMGYKIDLELEKVSRFKSLACEKNEYVEVWYYRDGTPDGLRIVTFEIITPDFFNNDGTKFSIDFKYY